MSDCLLVLHFNSFRLQENNNCKLVILLLGNKGIFIISNTHKHSGLCFFIEILFKVTRHLCCKNLCYFLKHTVEQEKFATGNFRDFRWQAIRVQESFANLVVDDLLGFQVIFMSRKFSRTSRFS